MPVCQKRSLVAALLCSLLLAACGGGDEPASGAASEDTAAGDGSSSGGASPSAPVPADASCGLPDFEAEVMRQINAARAAARTCGATDMPAVGSLAWRDQLFTAAARHSLDMASHNHFDHTGTDGSSSSQRVTAAGYAWSATGENIAAGYSNVSATMAGWLGSEGHCRNLMNPGFRDVAVSCVQRSGTTYGQYWTMVLARPR